jgi:hypothetical protein
MSQARNHLGSAFYLLHASFLLVVFFIPEVVGVMSLCMDEFQLLSITSQ